MAIGCLITGDTGGPFPLLADQHRAARELFLLVIMVVSMSASLDTTTAPAGLSWCCRAIVELQDASRVLPLEQLPHLVPHAGVVPRVHVRKERGHRDACAPLERDVVQALRAERLRPHEASATRRSSNQQ